MKISIVTDERFFMLGGDAGASIGSRRWDEPFAPIERI
jgi:hypothetical protein